MTILQNVYTHIQISNCNLLSFSFFLKGKSELALLNDKLKVASSCVKNDMDLKTADKS